jgi:hypothetical protein
VELTVDSELCTLRIQGPDRATGWSSKVPSSDPELSVEALGENVLHSVRWGAYSAEVGVAARFYRGHGPALSEETSYKVTIVSKSDVPVRLLHRDPTLFSDVKPVLGAERVLTGSINFRSQIGDCGFRLVSDLGELAVTVEVRPTKMDYDSDYSLLRTEVSGVARQLVLEYLRATYVRGSAELAENAKRLDWLLLLRSEIDLLEGALDRIVAFPHPDLQRALEMVPSHRIKKTSSLTLRAVIRGQGQGPWLDSGSIPRHRERLPTMSALETMDTVEHRWLRSRSGH